MAKPCLAASIPSEKYDSSVSEVSFFLLLITNLILKFSHQGVNYFLTCLDLFVKMNHNLQSLISTINKENKVGFSSLFTAKV